MIEKVRAAYGWLRDKAVAIGLWLYDHPKAASFVAGFALGAAIARAV